MPTAYPNSNDSFAAPSSPATTPLSSAGDSTRSHTQSHQDLGDAVVALQTNVPLRSHDHSGTEARPTGKLNQANTHQNADTDTATTALHHTLGTSANQSAAGNHTHDQSALNTQLFGGANRTKPFRGRAQYTGTSNASLAPGTDWPAAGGWTSDSSVDSGDSMVASDSQTGAVYILAPAAGLYLLTYGVRFISGGVNQYLNACFLKNSTASGTRSSAIQALSEGVVPNNTGALVLSGAKTIRLAANDRIFNTIAGVNSSSGGGNYQLVNNQLPNACSFWELTWVGA